MRRSPPLPKILSLCVKPVFAASVRDSLIIPCLPVGETIPLFIAASIFFCIAGSSDLNRDLFTQPLVLVISEESKKFVLNMIDMALRDFKAKRAYLK
jgi:hypothetical protein